LGERIEPRAGGICYLCNEPLKAGDVVYQVEGQRLPVHLGPCDDQLRAEPQRWFARLKSRGAFLGAAIGRQQLSRFWFFAGLYILMGLVFAAVCAHRALHTGHRLSEADWLPALRLPSALS